MKQVNIDDHIQCIYHHLWSFSHWDSSLAYTWSSVRLNSLQIRAQLRFISMIGFHVRSGTRRTRRGPITCVRDMIRDVRKVILTFNNSLTLIGY